MLELVNFTSLRTFTRHRHDPQTCNDWEKGTDSPSCTRVFPLLCYTWHDRQETHLHAITDHYFPALASPRGRRDAAIRIFQSMLHPADDSMHDRSRLPDRIYNVCYKHDIRYAMQLCRWILKPIGIWHLIYGRSSQSEKLLSLMLMLACFSFLCFVLVPAGPYILFREKDINIKVKLFGPVGFCLTSAIKYCFLAARVSAIGRCVEHVESDWQVVRHQDHRKMMLRNALVGRRLTTLCVIFLYTGGMSYHTIMPLSVRTNGSFSKPLV